MNKLKTNTRILLIIIVSVFIVVPFVSILLSKRLEFMKACLTMTCLVRI